MAGNRFLTPKEAAQGMLADVKRQRDTLAESVGLVEANRIMAERVNALSSRLFCDPSPH